MFAASCRRNVIVSRITKNKCGVSKPTPSPSKPSGLVTSRASGCYDFIFWGLPGIVWVMRAVSGAPIECAACSCRVNQISKLLIRCPSMIASWVRACMRNPACGIMTCVLSMHRRQLYIRDPVNILVSFLCHHAFEKMEPRMNANERRWFGTEPSFLAYHRLRADRVQYARVRVPGKGLRKRAGV